MNDKKKVCMQKRGERTRRSFFFCLLPKCSIRLFFFTPSASQKKSRKNRRVVFNSSNTILSLSIVYIYIYVCSSSSPLVFFFCIYARIWRLQTYINASKSRKTEKKEKKYGRPKTNGKHTNSFMLSQY